MANAEDVFVEEAIKSQIGRNAALRKYDRDLTSPMNYVLDQIEQVLPDRFTVYWVDGGFPSLFTLSGLERTPVVFSTRYLETVYFIRQVMVNSLFGGMREEISGRITLRTMAEFSLHFKNEELATLAFLKAVTGNTITIAVQSPLDALESPPFDEAYMMTWFYGLAHEIGHSLMPDERATISAGRITREVVTQFVDTPTWQFEIPPDVMRQVQDDIEALKAPGEMLSYEHLHEEASADIFAARVMFAATAGFMQRFGQDADLLTILYEVVIMLNIIGIIDRCRRTALIAARTKLTDKARAETFLNLHALNVRVHLLLDYLRSVIGPLMPGYAQDPDDALHEYNRMVDAVLDDMQPIFNEIEKGLASSITFMLYPDRRDQNLLVGFRQAILTHEAITLLPESERFLSLADSVEARGVMLGALRDVVNNPN